MTHDPKALRARFEAASPLGLELTFRAMFGGILVYVEGRPLASLSDVGLALKLAGSEREALLAVPGATPLRYEPDAPPSKTYVLVPEPMLDDAPALADWIARAVVDMRAQPAMKPRRRRGMP